MVRTGELGLDHVGLFNSTLPGVTRLKKEMAQTIIINDFYLLEIYILEGYEL